MAGDRNYTMGNVNTGGGGFAMGDKSVANGARSSGADRHGPPRGNQPGAGTNGGFSDDEVAVLAELYSSPPEAHALLRKAGYEISGLPVFDGRLSSQDFWWQVAVQIERGRLRDGRVRILTIARREYPDNRVLGSVEL